MGYFLSFFHYVLHIYIIVYYVISCIYIDINIYILLIYIYIHLSVAARAVRSWDEKSVPADHPVKEEGGRKRAVSRSFSMVGLIKVLL